MPNLKEQKGSYKGYIGECMFKLTRKWLILPKFFAKHKYMTSFGKHLTPEQTKFLMKNWHSVDGVEIVFSSGKATPHLYEIKTKNQYRKNLGFKPKATLSTVMLYEEAKALGFDVKLVFVILGDNWKYEIKVTDFDRNKICIDKPKKYDK